MVLTKHKKIVLSNRFLPSKNSEEHANLQEKILKEVNLEEDQRPFDSIVRPQNIPKFDVNYQITKKELVDAERYSQEAYMTQEKFLEKTQYNDNRKNSEYIVVQNAECRIYEHNRQVILSFAGTEQIMDMVSDLEARIVNLSYLTSDKQDQHKYRGIASSGFVQHTLQLYDAVKERLDYYYSLGITEFITASHSLGAITSLLFCYKYFLETERIPKRLYFFGSPMGMITYNNTINEIFDIVNVLHINDGFTYLFPIFAGHYGTKIVISPDGSHTVYDKTQDLPYIPMNREETLAYMNKKQGSESKTDYDVKNNWLRYSTADSLVELDPTGISRLMDSLRSLKLALNYPLLNKSFSKFIDLAELETGKRFTTIRKVFIDKGLGVDPLLRNILQEYLNIDIGKDTVELTELYKIVSELISLNNEKDKLSHVRYSEHVAGIKEDLIVDARPIQILPDPLEEIEFKKTKQGYTDISREDILDPDDIVVSDYDYQKEKEKAEEYFKRPDPNVDDIMKHLEDDYQFLATHKNKDNKNNHIFRNRKSGKIHYTRGNYIYEIPSNLSPYGLTFYKDNSVENQAIYFY